jgi:hypothetical protein
MKKVTFVPRPWPDLVLPKPENEVYILVKKVGQKRQHFGHCWDRGSSTCLRRMDLERRTRMNIVVHFGDVRGQDSEVKGTFI